MENLQDNVLKEHRTNTDNSLKLERNKTDNYLDNESQNIENETDEIVHTSRLEADKKLKESRKLSDIAKLDDDSDPSILLLDAERKRSDLAKNIARQKEDKVLAEERDQKKQIAQTLLNTERTDTDSKLLCERDGTDEATESNAIKVVHAQEALSIRDTYLGILSHDLKNPLTAIALSANRMKKAFLRQELDPQVITKYFEAIERNVSTMGRMIEDLLDVEQMVNGDLKLRLKACDLSEVLYECRELFEPIGQSKLFTIHIEPIEGEFVANIDHDRIFQVLSNLVGNAVKYTKQNGVIALAIKKDSDNIIVSVKDNGQGIPEDKLGIIFERFAQLDINERKGVGLGLFISKWIINSHLGEIFVESVLGKGSTFSFSIPRLK